MAKKKISTSAYDAIMRGAPSAGPTRRKVTPLGVPLTADEQDELQAIAEELGVKRHHLLLYAVRQFLKRWHAGERPQLEEQKINRLKMD